MTASRHDLVDRERRALAKEIPRPFENLKLRRSQVTIEVPAAIPLGDERERIGAFTVAEQPTTETASRPTNGRDDASGRAHELATLVRPHVERQGCDQHVTRRSSFAPPPIGPSAGHSEQAGNSDRFPAPDAFHWIARLTHRMSWSIDVSAPRPRPSRRADHPETRNALRRSTLDVQRVSANVGTCIANRAGRMSSANKRSEEAI